ncbi:MAG: hypothetical protein EAY69_11145 [Cytophagales bacterium]|nr:MAG: hypothetical protein EAY69_11145 [Cytophagales bacterium]
MQAGFNVLGFFVPNVNINASVPKSYIMYRFYDKNGVLLSTEFRLLSSASNGAWENLTLPTFEAETNGRLEVFVFNESNINVWFDDIQIQHIPTLISQENHYYAFGMNAKEIEKEGSNMFQYNSKEKESFPPTGLSL